MIARLAVQIGRAIFHDAAAEHELTLLRVLYSLGRRQAVDYGNNIVRRTLGTHKFPGLLHE